MVTVAGRKLSEFQAKMQSYPVIGSCAVDVEIFQGVNRSSMQALHNRRGARYLDCYIDFMGRSNFERTMHQSEFEALFLKSEPVEIDIGDGFWYRAILTQIGGSQTEGEYITTVSYRFQVTRHRGPEIVTQSILSDTKIFCQSNVACTDCVIQIPYSSKIAEMERMSVYLNGLEWQYTSAVDGEIVLDGINKIFTVNGENVTNQFYWSDFPYLISGENQLSVSVNGWVIGDIPVNVIYTPTFL